MDEARAYGDAALGSFAERADGIYAEAASEAQGELSAHLSRFADEDSEKAALVAAGALSAAAWASWRRRRMLSGAGWREACDAAAAALVRADVRGLELADRVRGAVYRENFDAASALVERMTGEPRPRAPRSERPAPDSFAPACDARRDYAWNRRKVREAVNAAMARGLAIPDIAASVRKVAAMGRASAVRAARTAVTSAEGRARLDVAADAAERGHGVRLEWISAVDGRTRDSHRALDGETVAPGRRFPNGLRFPADPQGPPHEVYNCRCTLGYVLDGLPTGDAERWNDLRATAYGDWKAGGGIYSVHLLERMAEREVAVEHAEDALRNPIFVGDVKHDEKGRPSRKYVGRQATVALNPKTKVIITAYRTGGKARARAERRRDEAR